MLIPSQYHTSQLICSFLLLFLFTFFPFFFSYVTLELSLCQKLCFSNPFIFATKLEYKRLFSANTILWRHLWVGGKMGVGRLSPIILTFRQGFKTVLNTKFYFRCKLYPLFNIHLMHACKPPPSLTALFDAPYWLKFLLFKVKVLFDVCSWIV